jgi:hypothetical protein
VRLRTVAGIGLAGTVVCYAADDATVFIGVTCSAFEALPHAWIEYMDGMALQGELGKVLLFHKKLSVFGFKTVPKSFGV